MNVIPLRHVSKRLKPTKPVWKGSGAVSMLLGILWLVTALLWPMLRWVLAVDVTFQFFRMLVGFSRLGLNIDWVFFNHFFLYVLMICFVTSKRGPESLFTLLK